MFLCLIMHININILLAILKAPKHLNAINNRGVTSIPGMTFADKLKQCKTASNNKKANWSLQNASANNASQRTGTILVQIRYIVLDHLAGFL